MKHFQTLWAFSRSLQAVLALEAHGSCVCNTPAHEHPHLKHKLEELFSNVSSQTQVYETEWRQRLRPCAQWAAHQLISKQHLSMSVTTTPALQYAAHQHVNMQCISTSVGSTLVLQLESSKQHAACVALSIALCHVEQRASTNASIASDENGRYACVCLHVLHLRHSTVLTRASDAGNMRCIFACPAHIQHNPPQDSRLCHPTTPSLVPNPSLVQVN
eukprot:1161350-Pelagomonas_calceolata.AAC.11